MRLGGDRSLDIISVIAKKAMSTSTFRSNILQVRGCCRSSSVISSTHVFGGSTSMVDHSATKGTLIRVTMPGGSSSTLRSAPQAVPAEGTEEFGKRVGTWPAQPAQPELRTLFIFQCGGNALHRSFVVTLDRPSTESWLLGRTEFVPDLQDETKSIVGSL